jgi:hypothetical protein
MLDELQYELFFNPIVPAEPPKLDTASWGIQLRIGWHHGMWQVAVAELDSVKDVRASWVPGRVPVMTWAPLDEYLKKLERLFGINP